MKALLSTCTLLIAVLAAIHIIGCGQDVTQDIDTVTFVSASPDIGNNIAANDTITLTFDGTPQDVDIRAVSGAKVGKFVISGKTLTIHGPFTQGQLSLAVTWLSGTATLAYTVTAPNPEDTNVIDETEEGIDSVPIHTDGKPVKVTDNTFKSVVLDAKLPVVLEFWAVW